MDRLAVLAVLLSTARGVPSVAGVSADRATSRMEQELRANTRMEQELQLAAHASRSTQRPSSALLPSAAGGLLQWASHPTPGLGGKRGQATMTFMADPGVSNFDCNTEPNAQGYETRERFDYFCPKDGTGGCWPALYLFGVQKAATTAVTHSLAKCGMVAFAQLSEETIIFNKTAGHETRPPVWPGQLPTPASAAARRGAEGGEADHAVASNELIMPRDPRANGTSSAANGTDALVQEGGASNATGGAGGGAGGGGRADAPPESEEQMEPCEDGTNNPCKDVLHPPVDITTEAGRGIYMRLHDRSRCDDITSDYGRPTIGALMS